MEILPVNQFNQNEFDFSTLCYIDEGACATVHKVKHRNKDVVLKKTKKETQLSQKEVSLK